jgi:adenine-specific DNA-methyltransferase
MDLSKKTRAELLAICRERGIKGCSTKKKAEILERIGLAAAGSPIVSPIVSPIAPTTSLSVSSAAPSRPPSKLQRLNYIGSKFQLLDWLTATIQEKTGWTSFTDKRVADLFAGTGVVSHHFRLAGAHVASNDAELYSAIIAHALTRSAYNETCRTLLAELQVAAATAPTTAPTTAPAGYITTNYSPYEATERKFFTVENARRIDFIRGRLEDLKPTLSHDDYQFLLASLLVSADAVSNVPAVYGCFLQKFKAKALKPLQLIPVHTHTAPATTLSVSSHTDVLSPTLLASIEADLVYLDPPYNERQYSKNYFPLNMIAKSPADLASEPPLKGKTGIPAGCFLSPFCKKGEVEAAFDSLIKGLNKAQWVFLSYNSESLVSKEKMLELLGKYGSASVVEREYKRFKSYEYNEDKPVQEYLFCLQRG